MSENLPTPRLVSSRLLAAAESPISADQQRRMKQPIIAGGITVLIFVVGFVVWASLFSVAGGASAPGVLAVENNRKTVEHLDGGVIRQILVKEGQAVKKGQVLIAIDDTQARATVDVLVGEYDSLLAQRARLEAELADRTSIQFPAELTGRASDPRVAGLMRDQETLFKANLGVYTAQTGVLGQRVQQLQSRSQGFQAQVKAVDEQSRLVADELKGVSSLYDRGFAPKSRMLALQRSQADLTGSRGAREADMAATGQAIGETRIQLAQLKEQRATQAADMLRQVQVQIAEILPRLRNAQAVLDRTQVRSPAEGVVLGLTQFTEGGVARPGERLMDIVPANTPLVVHVNVAPQNIRDIRPGLKAQVRLLAFQSRTLPPVDARVIRVSADRLTNEKGEAFFTADLVIDPDQLAKHPNVKLTPGMPVDAIIVTENRSIMRYLLSPLTDTFTEAFHER